MSLLEILVPVIAVAIVVLLAWCEDVRSVELNKTSPDGSVGGIDRASNPYWRNECDSAVPGRDECGQPSGQEAISPHSVSGLPRGGGPGVRVAPDPGATPSDRASGEATGHD